mmetsp:Transcript_25740/g.67376  ORF Transcript_25740/g.67376 Transcript_25740/m.67376 type:complete len:241 (-) Transcript_25740:79-801(-)
MTVLQGVTKLRRNVAITKRVNMGWRPPRSLFYEGKNLPTLEMGYPMLHTNYDILNRRSSGFRKYMPPNAPRPPVVRDADAYAPHGEDGKIPIAELLGKFRFMVPGYFVQNGELAEMEAFTTAIDLHLVGWMKVRKTFMSGHMQGDWTALSYFQRWLTEKHLSREAGTIRAVEIYEVNTGLMHPLVYTSLMTVKDNRKYGKRKNQLLKTLERAQISALESQTALERRRREEFTEEHCVRNY